MIKLEYTEDTGLGYRHRTWTRVGEDRRKLSALQNQFALSEFERTEDDAVRLFRLWLWQEMKDRLNVVWRELRELVRAHKRGEEVEILVPKTAPHGDVIVRAILWIAANIDVSEPPTIQGCEPASCDQYSPDGVLNVASDIDPKKIVWITGRTQSRIGVIVQAGNVLVPEYGLVPLKNFRWVRRKLATAPAIQQALCEEIDKEFEAEADAIPVEYESAPKTNTLDRYEEEAGFWDKSRADDIATESSHEILERDVLTLVEQLSEEIDDLDTALEIAMLPEIEDWYYKRPPILMPAQSDRIRPVYKHKGDNSPLMVKSAKDQIAGKGFRFANREETLEYIQVFRKK